MNSAKWCRNFHDLSIASKRPLAAGSSAAGTDCSIVLPSLEALIEAFSRGGVHTFCERLMSSIGVAATSNSIANLICGVRRDLRL